jgi:hypothetical protein
VRLGRIYWEMHETDPLPGRPDGAWGRRVLGMEAANAPLFTRSTGPDLGYTQTGTKGRFEEIQLFAMMSHVVGFVTRRATASGPAAIASQLI